MSVSIRNLKKAFGLRKVLVDVNVDFPAGEISTILGVSGCGKTTLLRIIAGLETADSGTVQLHGNDITDKLPQDRSIGFVFQDRTNYAYQTVRRNLTIPLTTNEVRLDKAENKANKIAKEFGIDHLLDQHARLLSGGEAQRLTLARALVREPSVTLLDEPFSHLDAPLQREARRLVFMTLAERESTSVLVTHDHEDAQEAGGKVVLLDRGRVVQDGTWEDLYRRPASLTVARVVSFVDPLELRGNIAQEDGSLLFVSEEPRCMLQIHSEELGADVDVGDSAILLIKSEDLVAVEGWIDGAEILNVHTDRTFMRGPTRFVRLTTTAVTLAAHIDQAAIESKAEFHVDLSKAPKLFFALNGDQDDQE